MRYIRTYEGFLNKRNINKSVDIPWNQEEVDALNANNIVDYRRNVSDELAYNYYYKPSVGDIEEIEIRKIGEDYPTRLLGSFLYYLVTLYYKNSKNKKFKFGNKNSLEKMINFVNEQIPDVEKSINKYNL